MEGRCKYCFENTPSFIISPLCELHGAKITECVSLPYLVARLGDMHIMKISSLLQKKLGPIAGYSEGAKIIDVSHTKTKDKNRL